MKIKKMKIPHVYVIIMTIVILASLFTYVIPAGEYATYTDDNGREIVIADEFEYVENTPVSPFRIPSMVIEGFSKASNLIFLVLIIGGAMNVIISTGLFHAVTSKLTSKLIGRESIIIPAFTIIFAIGCMTQTVSTFVGFTPIAVIIARSMGYDAIVGLSMVLIGAALGFSTGTFNPFTTGVAQEIAGLPMYSGLSMRFFSLVVLLIVSNIYIIRYAKKIKNNPALSIVYESEKAIALENKGIDQNEETKLELKHFLVLAVLMISMGSVVYGGVNLGYGATENSAIFLTMAIIGGLVGKMGPSRIAEAFLDGARNLVFGSLIIGVGRSIVLILIAGNVLNTVIYGLSQTLLLLPGGLRVVGMVIVQTIINVFIGDGSAQAAVTMPIMIPVADIVNVSRQSTVLAFNFGDGLSNYILPTSSALMAHLAMAGVPYDKWMKFMGKLYLIWIGIVSVILLFAHYIGY